MHHPTDRITHTTAFVTPVMEHWLEQEVAQLFHHEGSIRRPITPWANTLTTEQHLAPLIEKSSLWSDSSRFPLSGAPEAVQQIHPGPYCILGQDYVLSMSPSLCLSLFQPVLHDWCNEGHGICYPVCGMVHIKEPLLLIGKRSPCGSSGFPLSLSEWSFTTCHITINKMCWVCR